MPLRFTHDDAERAFKEWRFNCGPAALCAALDLTPAEIRPAMMDFERKGYTNPTLMFSILRGLNVPHRQTYRSDSPDWKFPGCALALMRVQWGGPWTEPGVPPQARYRHTHWVAVRAGCEGYDVFDVNATYYGGWLSWNEWATELVPWLIKQAVPKASGHWWPTHVIEIARSPS